MKRIKIGILLILMLFPMTYVSAAGTASISANNTVVNGSYVTATVTLNNTAAWNISIKGSGATSGCSSKEVGDSGTGNNTTKYFKVTCKATSIGTITFSYSGDITSADGNNINVSGSKNVTVVKPREKSNNNDLKSLSVDGYDISPKFDKNTLEYTVNLESSVEKIKINATKADGYASVSGAGEKDVVEGDNKFEIIVTSETGKKKTYILNAIVKDSNPIIRKVDGKEYSVVKRESALTQPENFTKTVVTIEETEIPAFYNESTKTILIGMKDENGLIYLFRYDNDNLTKYETLTSSSMTIIFEEPKDDNNLTKTTVTIDKKEYTAYRYKDNKDYVLIYGTELNTNTKNWYLYNIKENSIQTFIGDNTDELKEEFDNTLNEYKIVILSLAGLSIGLLIVIIVQIISKGKMKKKFKNKLQLMKEIENNLKNQLEDKEVLDKKKQNKTKSKK